MACEASRLPGTLHHDGHAGEIVIWRAALGLLLATAIALAGYRWRALAPSGAAAAIIVGTVCSAAGWTWATMLIAFFAVSSLLSRLGSHRKRSAERIVAKGGARDVRQVLANGGVFAAAALLSLFTGAEAWLAVGAGALGAAAADTWATEIGLLAPRSPVSILTLRPLPAGTSGGVTLLGTSAGLGGAAFVALIAWAGGWPGEVALGCLVGGVAGMTVDSLLGATLQERRRCPHCSAATERLVHDCGNATELAGGLSWLDNDGVNLAATLAGAMIALVVAGH